MIFVCFVVFTFLFVAFFGEIASKGSLRRLFNFKLLLL